MVKDKIISSIDRPPLPLTIVFKTITFRKKPKKGGIPPKFKRCDTQNRRVLNLDLKRLE